MGTKEDLRVELYRAVDYALDRIFGAPAAEPATRTELDELRILSLGPLAEPYSFPWPTEVETYPDAERFDLKSPRGPFEVLIARGKRDAWHRPDRGRVVVFVRPAGSVAREYPWLEFCEDDRGTYCADLRNPSKPRSLLIDGDDVPTELSGVKIERLDAMFDGVKDGPTLRMVVAADDSAQMIRLAYWTARTMGRI